MRKRILPCFTGLFILLTMIATSLHAGEQYSDFIRLGHADETLDGYDNLANPTQSPTFKRAVAIYVPASQMKPCRDNYIYNIKFALAFGTYFEENGLKVFVTKDLNKPYDYEQIVSNTVAMWNDIQLNTPFKIDGEGIYIGYEYYSTYKNNFGRLTSNQDTSIDWYYKDGEWKQSENSSALAIQGIVKGDKLPKYNVALKNTELLTYAELKNNMTISGEFTNIGTATLNSFDVNYRLNNGEWVSETIDNVNIPYESTYNFKTSNLKFPNIGEYAVEISIDKLNGKNDLDPSDNISKTYTVGCVDAYTKRNVLLEIFSTELCPNCPEGHDHINSVVNGDHQIIMVGHHSGYGKDDFTIQPSIDYERFYNHSLFAPAVMIDRSNQNSYESRYPDYSPVFNAGSLTKEQLENSLSIPAFTTVHLTTEYNENTREVTIHVDGKRLLPLVQKDYRLFIYLTEDNIFTSTQAGSVSRFFHMHTLRQVITDTWGNTISSDSYENEFHATIDKAWNANNMHVVAFTANYDEQDVNNCIVYNSAQANLTGGDSAIRNTTTEQTSIKTLGKHILIQGENNGFRLYNLTGKCLKESNSSVSEISGEGLPNGAYLLHLNGQGVQSTHKVLLYE